MSGSVYLGFIFAVLPLWTQGDVELAVVGVLVMWPFLFDTFITLLRRLLRGQNVFTAHRTHIYQRLVQTGLTHSRVTLLYGLQSFAGAAAACAMIWQDMTPWFAVVVLAAGSVLSCLLLRVRELRVRQSEAAPPYHPHEGGDFMTRSETAAPSVSRTRASWEDLGALDPLWAILSDSAHQFGRWNIDEFFATGEDEVRGVLAATSRFGLPNRRAKALDFGCGVGRLTRALAAQFDHAVGVDISQPMIDQAREYNRMLGNCTFVLNDRADLSAFPPAAFDFVYSNIALQHIQHRSAIYVYIRDFVRVLRPDGIAVFQLPSHLRLRNRLQLRPRLYNVLRSVGATPQFLRTNAFGSIQ